MGEGRVRHHTAMVRDHTVSVVETECRGQCHGQGGTSLSAQTYLWVFLKAMGMPDTQYHS